MCTYEHTYYDNPPDSTVDSDPILSPLVQGPAAAGGDPFGIPPSSGGSAFNDPFGGGGSSHEDSKTSPSKDPFADPFGSDSFGSSGWAGDSSTAAASTGVVSSTAAASTGVVSSTPKGKKTAKKVGTVCVVCGGG